MTRSKWYIKAPVKKSRDWTDNERIRLFRSRIKGETIKNLCDKFHTDRIRIYNQIRLMRKAISNRCFRCGRPLSINDIQLKKVRRTSLIFPCSDCRKELRDYKIKNRKRALRKGLCGICWDKPVVPGKTMCRNCISSTYRRRIAKGLCGICGKKPLKTGALCHSCADRMSEKAKERRLIYA